MSSNCTLKRLHTLADGSQKTYSYATIGGKPASQYQKDRYEPRQKRIPKFERLPQVIKDEIVRFHEHGIGAARIVALIGSDPRFQNMHVGKHSVVKFLKSHSAQE